MASRATVPFIAVMTAAGIQMAQAVSGTWTGSAGAAWTNSANWTGSTHPGSGTLQTATFNSGGNGNTVLDLLGLASIRNVAFTNSSSAAYTLGTGGPDGQTLVFEGSGLLSVAGDVAATQRVDAALQLHSTASASSHTFRNDSLTHPLVLAGQLTGAPAGGTPGVKTIAVLGDGDTYIGGGIAAGGGTSVRLISYCAGTLTLAGANTFDSDTEFYSGTLRLAHPGAMGGLGRILIRTPPPGGVIELAHDGESEIPFRMAIGNYNSIWNTGTVVSGVGTGTVGRNHVVGELGMSGVAMNFTRSAQVTSGSPSITVQKLDLNGGGTYTSTLNPTTADLILGDVTASAGSFRKTLVLDGTAEGNRVDGIISNGVHTLSVIKSNSGTWSLLGANVYTGTTEVADGTIALVGAAGSLKTTALVTLAAGGTLVLDNTAAVNADRLADAAPLTLAGGTLRFDHAGGASDYGETAGPLTLAGGDSTVSTARADEGRTSVLTLASLAYTGGTVNFEGEGLGADARNQIRFSTPPTLTGGIIGPWATVNGTNYATYGANGITAYSGSYADIEALGSTVPDDAAVHARIVADGAGGDIELSGSVTNRIATLQQTNADIPARVATASKTLLTSGLIIAQGSAALTIGASVNSGSLAALSTNGVLSFGNGSTNPLTVNATLADNTAASLLTKFGPGPVVLNGTCAHTGPLVINEGDLVFGGHAVPQVVAGVISGAGALVKTGTNLLHLLAANTYAGPTTIREGVARPNQNTAFGTAAGGVFLEAGATLDIGCTPDVGGTRGKDGLNFGTEQFNVSGAGADGKGVIVNSATGSQNNAFGRIALTDDAAIGGSGDWRLQNNTPTLTLNGHTLTKAGANMFDLYSANVMPGGGHINVAAGTFRILYDTDMSGSGANTLSVQSGAELNLYRLAIPQSWTLIMDNGSTVNISSSTNSVQNRWAGPVTLNGAATLTGGSYIADIQGAVSGTGSVTKAGSASITLSATNSTYTGATRITGGRLLVKSLRPVGEPSSLGQPTNAAAGAIVIGSGATIGSSLEYIGAGDTTDRVITMGGTTGGATLYHNGTGPLKFTRDLDVAATGNKNLVFRGDSSAVAEFAGNLANVGGNVITVSKNDSGWWTFTGTNTFTGALTVDNGTLALSGSNALAGAVTVNAGKLIVSGALSQGAATCYVTGTTSSNGVLRMTAGSNLSGTGDFSVGRVNGLCGAFYLEGGTFTRETPNDDAERFALGYNAGGYGYLKVSGGTLTATRLQLGTTSGTTLGMGIVRITGGTLQSANTFHISRNTNSVGVVTIDGGTLNHSNASTFIQMGYRGGRGELNLTGGNLVNDGQTIQVRYSSGNATGIVNLCAGTLSLDAFLNNSTGTSWLNFRGGTLRASADSPAFIPSAMTGVYSYGPLGAFAGGAVIDTAGRSVTVAEPVQAPGGNGVTAVSVLEQGSGYVGEPYVSITGGGGFGAAAVANMADDGTGNGTYRVAGVTITSPGVGYTGEPTVTFLRGGNGVVTSTVASVALTPNTSGGLTKRGNGTLTLSAVNTYTGATTVAGGTLKLTNAKALPTQTPVVLAGGTLDLNGYTVTNALSGTGLITNGTVRAVLSPAGAGAVGTDAFTLASASLSGVSYVADVTAAGDSDLVSVQGDINLSGMTLQIVDPSRLSRGKRYTLLTCAGTRSGTFASTNLPDSRWHVVYLAGGTVQLIFVDGTLIKLL